MNGDDLYHDDVGKYEIENPQPKSWLDENQVVCIIFIVIHQLTLTRSISISNWSLIIQVALLRFCLVYSYIYLLRYLLFRRSCQNELS